MLTRRAVRCYHYWLFSFGPYRGLFTSLFAPLRVPIFRPLAFPRLERPVEGLLCITPTPPRVTSGEPYPLSFGAVIEPTPGLNVPPAVPPACAYVIAASAITRAEAQNVLLLRFMVHLRRGYVLKATAAHERSGARRVPRVADSSLRNGLLVIEPTTDAPRL
jgi:hypothetical protein